MRVIQISLKYIILINKESIKEIDEEYYNVISQYLDIANNSYNKYII